ncbi:MAG: hypothetical protein U5R31_04910 [Acidimicrobiia bacterium]|nr:hypothetical protein [Acidimicrobiia bacterium]
MADCNVYFPEHFSAEPEEFNDQDDCQTPYQLAEYYCPTDRQSSQLPDPPGPDYLGVYIEVSHDYTTGLFGNSLTLSDQAITRLEPLSLNEDSG